MPAPKAVLRDIADRGLDPTRPHGRIGSDGRLAHPQVSAAAEKAKPEAVVPEHRPKPHVDPIPPVPARVEEVTKPSAEPAVVEEQPVAEVVDEKSAAEGMPETEQASPAAKKGRGKKPAAETQA